ncbi:MAG: stage II sporulation protein M [Methanobrevibacter sp.]|nr:stage II sporulation protein M [Methanobrevibacter sp.]
MNEIKYYIDLIKKEIKIAFKDNSYLLLFSTLLFLIPMFLGYFFPQYLDSLMNPVVDTFRNRVETGEIKLVTDSIFLNNFNVAIVLYFGAIFIGLLTAMILIINGMFIGYFASSMNLGTFLLLTLPHGIIELPAIIIAACGGFVLLNFIINFIIDIFKNQNNRIAISFNDNLDKLVSSLVFLGIAIVLLAIASFIEVYFTIGFANFVMGL